MGNDGDGRRPTKLVLGAVGLFVLAVFLGRLLVAGGAAWGLLVVVLPGLLVAAGATLGFRAALVVTLSFTGLVLALRWLLRENPGGWIAILLIPIVALTAIVVGKVLAQMRRPQEPPAAP